MPPELHEDFGEKIGGAKKDLWKDRGLYTDDLDGMNEREAEKYVKKDNVWKKPDYQAMLDEGTPLGVVFFMKKARDSLNASPQYPYRDNTPEKRLDRQKQYVETVRELQAVVEGVRTVEDVMQVCDRFFLDNGYLEKRHGYGSTPAYQGTKKGSDNPVITNKLFRALRVHSPAEFERDYTRQAQKEQFGVAKEQKVPRGYELHFYDGKGYSRNRDWKEGTYYVTKGYSILQDNLPTREAALRWAQEHAKGRGKSGKQRFVPPQLEHIIRTGPDYRNGQEIVGQHYLDTFGFRGGEFGNWLNQNDRQASLNMGFEALKDLAAALHVSDKDIAYQGTLAIAFGARGSGNAAAHYEPLRKVINLTKMHGAGSLAHEWWHGLDDYLGGKMGAKGFLSDNAHLYPPMKKLIDAMKFKAETPEQAAKRAEVQNTTNGCNIKIFYPTGLKPTRKNVLDKKAVGIYSGGVNYFPFYPMNKDVSAIDTLLQPFEDDVYSVSLKLMIKVMEQLESEVDDWNVKAFIGFINTLLATDPTAQGKLIVRRNRDIGKGTGTLLSPTDRRLGDEHPDDLVLTMYKITGNKDKGWDGTQIWIPNIKLPGDCAYYSGEN